MASAFDGWGRRSVTQWQQYHVFRARARVELAPERTPGIHVRPLTVVGSLLHDDRRREVVGVETSDGTRVEADVVVDCGGRRSPVAGWVTAAGYQREPATRMSCGIAYYTRYYELVGGRDAPRLGRGG